MMHIGAKFCLQLPNCLLKVGARNRLPPCNTGHVCKHRVCNGHG